MPYSNAIRPQVTLDGAVYDIFDSHIIIITLFYPYLFSYLSIFIYAWPASTIDWVTIPWVLDRCLLYIASV